MAAGDLDTSFSGNGKKSISFGGIDQANAVLVQPNGRILVVGGGGPRSSFCVARLRSDGKLDQTFGAGGKRAFSFGCENEAAFGAALQTDVAFGKAVALQGNGRIVVSGDLTAGDNFAVARLRG